MSSGEPRYIQFDSLPPAPSLSSRSLSSLRQILARCLSETVASVNQHAGDDPRSNVYTGLAGISLLNHRLSLSPVALHAMRALPEQLSELAIMQLDRALTSDPLHRPSAGSKVAFLATSVGAATLLLLYQLRHYTSRHTTHAPFSVNACARAAQILTSAVSAAAQPCSPSEEGCELLYGRAGLLYALLLLRQSCPAEAYKDIPSELTTTLSELICDQTVRSVVDDIMRRGREGAARFARELDAEDQPALMWSWHGKRYLGGAHGVAGILDVVMHAPAHIVKPHAADIEDTVAYVIGLQDSHGNWPSKAGPRRKNPLASENTLIQWCHGAPGILTLLSTSILSCSTLEFSSELENSLVSALVRGASLTHSRGLLRKGPGLCHGVGGTATVLFQAADALASQPEEQRACLRRALHLLQCYAELRGGRHFAKPDRPWSLYEGVAGAAAALTEALERVEGLLSQGAEGMGMPRGHPSGLLGSGDLDLPARA